MRITPLPRLTQALPKSHVLAWTNEFQTVYWVEQSTDLTNWTTVNVEQQTNSTGTIRYVTVPEQGKAFFRVGRQSIPIVVPQEEWTDPNQVVTMKHRGP